MCPYDLKQCLGAERTVSNVAQRKGWGETCNQRATLRSCAITELSAGIFLQRNATAGKEGATKESHPDMKREFFFAEEENYGVEKATWVERRPYKHSSHEGNPPSST